MSLFIVQVVVSRSEIGELQVMVTAGDSEREKPQIVGMSKPGVTEDEAVKDLVTMYQGFNYHVQLTDELEGISMHCGFDYRYAEDAEVQALAERISTTFQMDAVAAPGMH